MPTPPWLLALAIHSAPARPLPAARGAQSAPPARCNADGSPRVAAGPVADWHAALPAGAEVQQLAAADVDGDGRVDALLAVRVVCGPDNRDQISALVAWNTPAGFTLALAAVLGEGTDFTLEGGHLQGGYGRAIALGGERFVVFAATGVADEGFVQFWARRVGPGRALTAAALPGEVVCRAGSRFALRGADTVVFTCPSPRSTATLRWDAAQSAFVAAPTAAHPPRGHGGR